MGPLPTLCLLILSLVTMSDLSLAACTRQKLLEDILSPANAERALQILQLASVGANRVNPGSCSLLDDVYPRYLPQAVPVPLPLPRPVYNQPIIDVLPDLYPPKITPTVIREKVYPGVPIPQPCATPAVPVAQPYPAPAVPVPFPGPAAPYPQAPVPLVNPFLPAASPVSALAPPTSSLLPPVVPTQVRSHFLRKIPIPPPSI